MEEYTLETVKALVNLRYGEMKVLVGQEFEVEKAEVEALVTAHIVERTEPLESIPTEVKTPVKPVTKPRAKKVVEAPKEA